MYLSPIAVYILFVIFITSNVFTLFYAIFRINIIAKIVYILKDKSDKAEQTTELIDDIKTNCENHLFFLNQKTADPDLRSLMTEKSSILLDFALVNMNRNMETIILSNFYEQFKVIFDKVEMFILRNPEITSYDDGHYTFSQHEIQSFKDRCAEIILKGNGKRKLHFSESFIKFHDAQLNSTFQNFKKWQIANGKTNYVENRQLIKDNLLILLGNSEYEHLFRDMDNFITDYKIEYEIKHELILLRGRWTTLNQRKDYINNDDFTIELNKIRDSIQKLIIDIFCTI